MHYLTKANGDLFTKRDIKKLPDETLVKRYHQSHDTEILGELYQRHTEMTFLVAMKYLKNEDHAREAVMQIFEKLIEDLKTHEVSQFKYWLYSVCKNHCLMILRSQKRQQKHHEEYQKNASSDVELGASLHLIDEDPQEERLKALEEALEELNEVQKRCISLFYLEDKSYKEIEAETGLTYKEVKSHIQNGKRNLKKQLTHNSLLWLLMIYIFN